MRRKKWYIMRTKLMVLFACSVVFVLFNHGCSPHGVSSSRIPFDSAKWQAGIADRAFMVQDLVTTNSYLSSKMTKADIEKLLGTPDRICSKSEIPGMWGGVEEWLEYEMELDKECFDCHVVRFGVDSDGNYAGFHIFKN